MTPVAKLVLLQAVATATWLFWLSLTFCSYVALDMLTTRTTYDVPLALFPASGARGHWLRGETELPRVCTMLDVMRGVRMTVNLRAAGHAMSTFTARIDLIAAEGAHRRVLCTGARMSAFHVDRMPLLLWLPRVLGVIPHPRHARLVPVDSMQLAGTCNLSRVIACARVVARVEVVSAHRPLRVCDARVTLRVLPWHVVWRVLHRVGLLRMAVVSAALCIASLILMVAAARVLCMARRAIVDVMDEMTD